MPTFGNGGLQVNIPDFDFKAAVAEAVAEEMVTVRTELEAEQTAFMQAFIQSNEPPTWWGGGGGGNSTLFQLGAPVTITSTDFSPVLTFNYTPKSLTSKLIFLGLYNVGQSAPNITTVAMFRGSTNLALAGLPGHDWIREPNIELADIMTLHGFLASDTPNSIAEQTYSLKAKVFLAGQISHVGKRQNSGSDGPMPPGASVLVLES
jgi:hypothetical protein